MRFHRALLGLLLALILCAPASAQRLRRPGAVAANILSLPYTASDAAGNQWLIYQGGWMQQRGNAPVYGQSAMLTINGNAIAGPNNQIRRDPRTSELVFENLGTNIAGVTLTRRILVEQREGYLRYIDVLRNSTQQEQSLNCVLQSNLNYGITNAQFINEARGKERPLGWAAATPVGRGAVELFAGRGGKVLPSLNWQANSNFIQAQMQVVIPAGKEVAIMHVHATCATPEEGMQQMNKLSEGKLLSGVSGEIRKALINFAPGGSFLGDREVLRGDVLDVIELRGGGNGGDQLKGTIKEVTLKLDTFYGQIDLASDKVVGMINVGQFRPRQLIISSDGEVFGGRLNKETIEFELSSGQTTQVPLSQISRIGWRKRAGENDDAAPTTQPAKARLSLRSGDRIAVEIPKTAIDVVTRYGLLKLQPQTVAAIDFASEDVGVHRIYLTDGSRFAGLVAGDTFAFNLSGGAGGQAVTLPASALSRLQLVGAESSEPDESSAMLQLSNGDLLIGALVGDMKLDTAFDTITVSGPQIKSLSRSPDGGADVQIELWDESRLGGQLQQQELTCALASGVSVKVPVMMVTSYDQPAPQPSATMIDRIKKLVGELSAEEWKDRERAQQQLTSIGVGVVSILRQMRPNAVPEAQQRIDAILKALDAKRSSDAIATPPAPIDNGD